MNMQSNTLIDHIDKNTGKVTIFEIEEERVLEVWPIDAQDALANNTAVLSVTLSKGGHRTTETPAKALNLIGEGWRIEIQDQEFDPAVDVLKLTMANLKIYAKQIGVEFPSNITKPKLTTLVTEFEGGNNDDDAYEDADEETDED